MSFRLAVQAWNSDKLSVSATYQLYLRETYYNKDWLLAKSAFIQGPVWARTSYHLFFSPKIKIIKITILSFWPYGTRITVAVTGSRPWELWYLLYLYLESRDFEDGRFH